MEFVSDEVMLKQVKKWVYDVVVGLNFCPFAKHPYEQGLIRYVIMNKSFKQKQELQFLLSEMQELDNNDCWETTIIVVPKYEDFFHYLNFLDMANHFIDDQGYSGVYQFASFHPDYLFEGTDDSDPANYTNRSPYPLLHLIKEESIDRALKHYPKSELIPEKNSQLARKLGLGHMQKLLKSCFNVS